MSRISYVNGRYLGHQSASIHIEDRGFQFSDGVYEVCKIDHGFIFDLQAHLDRLYFSLAALSISFLMKRAALEQVIKEVIRRNDAYNGFVYIQITRGVAPRNHLFPSPDVAPSLVISAHKQHPSSFTRKVKEGVEVRTVPENRWRRVDIKSIALLGNVLAREEAKKHAAQEAWFVDKDGYITEGAASNAWIVNSGDVLVTHPLEGSILAGITRKTLMHVAKALSIKIEERAFRLEEALSAKEAFSTAATIVVMPVVRINGHQIGEGQPGKITYSLRNHFFIMAEKTPVF